MKIIDILSAPWAIMPEKHAEIFNIYVGYHQGDKLDRNDIKELLAKESDKSGIDEKYQVVNDKAIINISGPMMKNPSWVMEYIFGAASMVKIGEAIQSASMDKKVNAIILNIDSPGGTVDGTEELGNIIYQARELKPIISYTDGMMASAAVWVGSAAHEIYISGETVTTGSIGVATYHVDASKLYEDFGLRITDIYAGKYKRIASDTKPLSKEGKGYIQGQIDGIYKIFVDTVARYRGVSSEDVLNNMADGKLFLGSEAIRVGLVDGVLSMSDLIAMDYRDIKTDRPENKIKTEVKPVEITIDYLQKEHSKVFEDIKKIGASEKEKEKESLKIEAEAGGKKSENERVKAILSLENFGDHELTKSCIADMNCSAGDAAIKFNQAQKGILNQAAKNISDGTPPPVSHEHAPEVTNNKNIDTSKMSTEDAAKHEWENDKKVQEDFTDFESFLAYRKNEDNVRIKGGK